VPLLSAGLEKARMGFGEADFEGCLLGSAVVAGRVPVATVVSRVRRVQPGSSGSSLSPNKSLDGERTELSSATVSMLY
jgi:hypothetical protein